MKETILTVITYVLYQSGDQVSKLMLLTRFYKLYSIYNWLMNKSSDFQELAGLDHPWKTIERVYVEGQNEMAKDRTYGES